MSSYKVVYTRDPDGRWIARVPTVKGCHTYGRTIHEARRRIREALGLFVDDGDTAALNDDVRLPAAAKRLVRKVHNVRYRLKKDEAELAETTARAAKVLRRSAGLSVRDAGALLGLSGQRIHQLESGKK